MGDEYEVLTPDRDRYSERLSVPPVRGIMVCGLAGTGHVVLPAGLGLRQGQPVYRFPHIPQGRGLQEILHEAEATAALKRRRRPAAPVPLGAPPLVMGTEVVLLGARLR